MDDPIFGPWEAETSEVPAPKPVSPSRWRSAGPAHLVQHPFAASNEEERLGGIRGFLRTMGVPRLETLARQLRLARHEARVGDLLAKDPPLIRFEMRSWKGPLTHAPDPPFSTMDVELEEGEDAYVVVRMWVDPTVTPVEESRMPAVKLRAAWLDEMAIRFVAGVLDRD